MCSCLIIMLSKILIIYIFFQQIFKAQEMVIVVDYQKDFLYHGRLGANLKSKDFLTPEKYNEYVSQTIQNQMMVTENIVKLLWKFENKPILFSKDNHPSDHISFLSTHIKLNEGNEKNLAFLNDKSFVGIKTAQIIYNAQTCMETENDTSLYDIKTINYGTRDKIKPGEIELIQELWPDHCIKYSKSQKKSSKTNADGVKLERTIGYTKKVLKKSNKKIHMIKKAKKKNMDAYSIVKNNIGNIFSKVPQYIREYKIKKVYLTGVAADFCVLHSARDISALFPDVEVYIVSDATISIGLHEQVLKDIEIRESNIKLISTEQIIGEENGSIEQKIAEIDIDI